MTPAAESGNVIDACIIDDHPITVWAAFARSEDVPWLRGVGMSRR